jgi:hypothetical protein
MLFLWNNFSLFEYEEKQEKFKFLDKFLNLQALQGHPRSLGHSTQPFHPYTIQPLKIDKEILKNNGCFNSKCKKFENLDKIYLR